MLDTVILAVSKEKMKTLDDKDRFPSWRLSGAGSSYIKWVKNMPKRKHYQDLYYPRLTAYKHGNTSDSAIAMVHIEFSVPKLLYLNNLDEVEEGDFMKVLEVLKERLLEMGEATNLIELKNAIVTTFHPSKNIVLSDGYRAYDVIKNLEKINVHKKLELTKVNFKDDGKALQLYAKSYSLVIYDKMADMNQYKNKAVDKDRTYYQLSLFDELKKEKQLLEVLRLEIRLCNKIKLNSILKKMGHKENPTFEDIFKKDICRKTVLWYWETIIKNENLFLFEIESNPMQLLKDILRVNPTIKVGKAIELVGLSVLSKDGGIRTLRDVTEKRITRRNWYPLINKTKILNKTSKGKSLCSWVRQIESTLETFDAYKVVHSGEVGK